MKRIIVFALTACLTASLAPDSGHTDDLRVISLEARLLPREAPAARELDILMEKDGRLYIVSTPRDRATLDALGIRFAFEPSYSGLPAAGPAAAGGGLNGDYHSYPELEAELLELEAAYPGLAAVHILGQSLEGRNIYGLKISDNVGLDEDEAEVLFLGCHHAREWISVEVPLLIARHLLENRTVDSRVRDVVDRSETWIVPLVNPDGLEYSIHVYRYWRKNRRANDDGSFGVDLNRNYGYEWGRDNSGSSPLPQSAVYRGTAPFSEPESAAVRDFVGLRSFLGLVSYHSYGQIILYPWGYARIPVEGEGAERMKALAEGMSGRLEAYRGTRYAFGQASYSLYLTNGDTTDWAFGDHGIPAYTIELSPVSDQDGGFFNAETEILPIFYENLEAALYLIEDCIAVYVPPATDGRAENRPDNRASGGARGGR
ncbi:MAG: zinc carboxypeptidase [Candidatus Aminicenantes bacterium]|nr:zinc carboxypeptidase [Candidatus Aminicenantes bacterium]